MFFLGGIPEHANTCSQIDASIAHPPIQSATSNTTCASSTRLKHHVFWKNLGSVSCSFVASILSHDQWARQHTSSSASASHVETVSNARIVKHVTCPHISQNNCKIRCSEAQSTLGCSVDKQSPYMSGKAFNVTGTWNTSKALWRGPVVSCCSDLAVMAQEANSWDSGSIPGRDTSFDVPESSCLLSGPWLQLDSR